jgi:hypothetical protein
MTKTILTPDSTTVTITIPDNYIGEPIEILAYPLDEIQPAIQA